MSVYKRPGSSVWQYEFELKGQRYRGTTGETEKSLAILFEAKQREQAKETANNPGLKFWTWGQAAALWLEQGEVERRDFENDKSRVRKLFGRVLEDGQEVPSGRHAFPEDLMIHETHAGHVAELFAARRTEVARHGRKNAPGTMNRELALLQAICEFARRSQVKMPAQPIVWRDYRAREPRGKLRYLSEAEEAALLQATADEVGRYKDPNGPQARMAQDQFDLLVFLLDTGARYDEVASLSWSCVDLGRGTVELYRRKVDNEGTLGLTRRLWRLLEHRRSVYPNTTYIFSAWDRGRLVTDRPRGWSTNGLLRKMDALGINDPDIVKRKGKATAHTMRDTFAARQIKAGATLYELQHLLGHADPKMTQKYAHIYDDFGKAGASRLDALHELNRLPKLAANKFDQGDDPIAKPRLIQAGLGVLNKFDQGDDPIAGPRTSRGPALFPDVAVPAVK